METSLDFGRQPIVHHYLDQKNQEFPTYPFVLESCATCGFMQLADPIDPDILYVDYFTVSSWKFQPHMQRLVDLILQHTGLTTEAAILEVGSNDGSFLQVLKDAGFSNLLGMEPTGDASRMASARGIETTKCFLNPESAQTLVNERGPFDLLIARQVLEHIVDLTGFRSALSVLLRPGGFVAIEVPNSWMNLREPDYTLWEEHVNYFTLETLEEFLSRAGVQILCQETILFSGECLTVIGKYTGESSQALAIPRNTQHEAISRYGRLWAAFRTSLQEILRGFIRQGHRIAVYGAGARACTFVNFTGIGPYINCFVDDQAEKQGRWVPGCRLPILSSQRLYDDDISICLLGVNTENEQRVMARHARWMESGGKFRSILPPSNMLLEVWPLK